ELGQPVDHGFVEHVPLVARLERPAEGALVEVSHPPGRIAADLETPVSVLDEVLFGGKIGVLLRHGSYNSIGCRTLSLGARSAISQRQRSKTHCHTPRLTLGAWLIIRCSRRFRRRCGHGSRRRSRSRQP